MSGKSIKVALDAMGSDNFPLPEIGVLKDLPDGVDVVLVGDEGLIRDVARREGVADERYEVVHAPERVGMDENPLSVRTRKNSSIVRALTLLKEGEVDAVVSAGNTGAVMTASVVTLGRLEGVSRPAIAGWIPTTDGYALMLDLGANVDCKSEHLVGFALMGDAAVRVLRGIERPRVALLSNGEEEIKGNEVVKGARDLLKELPLNFIGYVEGKDVFSGMADVIVCDGFVGNALLKGWEGLAEFIMNFLKQDVKKHPLSLLGALLLKKTFKRLKEKFDYSEYGGAPLVGINGIVVIAHGRADSVALRNAIKMAGKLAEADYLGELKKILKGRAFK